MKIESTGMRGRKNVTTYQKKETTLRNHRRDCEIDFVPSTDVELELIAYHDIRNLF